MIDGGGGINTPTGIAEGGRRLLVVVMRGIVSGALLAACTSSLGTFPRVALLSPLDGHKMLRPNEAVTECRAEGPAAPTVDGVDDLAQEALRRLLALDDEANAVINARVESTWWSIGVYGRRCVTLRGDLVRSTSTVLLPMPGVHGEHGGH
jgi:uncharacterized membrane protein